MSRTNFSDTKLNEALDRAEEINQQKQKYMDSISIDILRLDTVLSKMNIPKTVYNVHIDKNSSFDLVWCPERKKVIYKPVCGYERHLTECSFTIRELIWKNGYLFNFFMFIQNHYPTIL